MRGSTTHATSSGVGGGVRFASSAARREEAEGRGGEDDEGVPAVPGAPEGASSSASASASRIRAMDSASFREWNASWNTASRPCVRALTYAPRGRDASQASAEKRPGSAE